MSIKEVFYKVKEYPEIILGPSISLVGERMLNSYLTEFQIQERISELPTGALCEPLNSSLSFAIVATMATTKGLSELRKYMKNRKSLKQTKNILRDLDISDAMVTYDSEFNHVEADKDGFHIESDLDELGSKIKLKRNQEAKIYAELGEGEIIFDPKNRIIETDDLKWEEWSELEKLASKYKWEMN